MYVIISVRMVRMVADVWKRDVWEFQAKSGSSGSCRLFLHFPGKIAVQETSGKKSLEVPDILLPDIRSLLNGSFYLEKKRHRATGGGGGVAAALASVVLVTVQHPCRCLRIICHARSMGLLRGLRDACLIRVHALDEREHRSIFTIGLHDRLHHSFNDDESWDAFDHDKGQKSAISGCHLHWTFLNFLHWIWSLFSSFTVLFSKEIAPKCGEFSGGQKKE